VVGWGDHPITSSFTSTGLPLLAAEARSVRAASEGSATPLLRTSERSYAETDLRALRSGSELVAGDGDLTGPVSIAVAAQAEVLAGAAEGGAAQSADEGSDEVGADEGEDEGGGEDDGASSGGRVVVVGDATMFASEYLQEPTVVNRDFVSAAVGWLTEREALLAIEARTIESRPVSMSEADVDNLFLRVVVLIPLAFVFLGFAVWWNRRQ
jgi:ABC-type uncharacterized transport system involved in gliding motility auxiliary subunit